MQKSPLIIGLIILAFFCLFHESVLAAPPLGFQSVTVVNNGLTNPTGLGIAPDGRIFILEQSGNIKIYKNGLLLPRIFDQLPSTTTGDRGLLGIAFDPQWNANHYVYFYYIDEAQMHRVVRFNGAGDVATDGPVNIYNSGIVSNFNHAGGTIQFGPDGKLYISIGDSGQSTNAQDLTNPLGKILRINKDGSIPQDNPFVTTPGTRPEIWAYGFRNPFRFQFDAASGILYEGDVGEATWEEVNKVVRGGNYGWPNAEGVCSNCPYINPFYTYSHNNASASITGGLVYRGSMFPSDYVGSYFFGDYAKGTLKRLTVDAQGNLNNVVDFDLNVGTIVDMKAASDGSLYYVTIFPGSLQRVVFTNGNQFPSAQSSADTLTADIPLTIHFSSAGSNDPEGASLTYAWDFGDGTTSNQANPTKIYATKGRYTVNLTVSDGVNSAIAFPLIVQAGIPPSLNIDAPLSSLTYTAGDSISYAFSGKDSQGQDLPTSAFTTEIIFHHQTHIHPFIRPFTTKVGSFVVPTTGEASSDTWYEIAATATDADGLLTSKSVSVRPQLTSFTLDSQPQGLQLTLNGQPITTPSTLTSVVNFQHDLDAPSQQLAGQYYDFISWSDGGIKHHSIQATGAVSQYKATFQASSPYKGEYFTNPNLSGTPTLVRNDPLVNFTWNEGSPDPLIPSDGFSVRWSKNQFFPAGRYKFSLTIDDGGRLFIDGNLVIDKWIDQAATTYTAVLDLSQGQHDVRVEYYEAAGGSVAKFFYDVTSDPLTPAINPPSPPPADGFQGEYFTNMDLQGNPTLVQTDQTINFDWALGSPDSTIPNDNFSVRWTKTSSFEAKTYQFSVTADDGVRLYLDGSLLLDKWFDQPSTTYLVQKDMSAGNHDIKMEYYEHGGGAVAKLSWQPVQSGTQPAGVTGFRGEYFANAQLLGTPVLVRDDSTLNFNWGGGSPDPTVPVDNFSARWTKTIAFDSAIYRFTVTADDGVRLYVDGQLLINKWIDQPATTYSADKPLSAGNHDVKVEYYEHGGGAVVSFQYAKQFCKGEYFDNINLQGAPKVVQNDDAINFTWNEAAPLPGMPADNFSVRWSTGVILPSGDYQFTVTADDGVRLYLDNTLVLDKWIDEPSTTYVIQQSLLGGNHDIKMEYYEHYGGAIAKLAWKLLPTPATGPSTIAGFKGEYFDNPILSGNPVLIRDDSAINFDWGAGSPDPFLPSDDFSVRWTKNQTFAAGSYNFSLRSDDGIRFWVDDQLLVDDWTDHPSRTYSPSAVLSAGPHALKIEYYEHGGGAIASFAQL